MKFVHPCLPIHWGTFDRDILILQWSKAAERYSVEKSSFSVLASKGSSEGRSDWYPGDREAVGGEF